MDTGDALLAAVLADPADDLPRLAYADWLDESGGREGRARAEFIRVQLALARPGADPGREALLERQRGLWQAHGPVWWRELPEALRAGVVYRRGFLDEYRGGAALFFPGAAAFWRQAPARVLAVTGPTWPQLRSLARTPEVARLEQLELVGGQIAGPPVADLLQSPHLGRLRELTLTRAALTAADAATLAASPWLGRLRVLDLRDNQLGDAGVASLAGSPGAAGLTHLDLAATGLGPAGAAALADSPHLAGLERLEVAWNRLDGPALARLRQRFGPRVEVGRQLG